VALGFAKKPKTHANKLGYFNLINMNNKKYKRNTNNWWKVLILKVRVLKIFDNLFTYGVTSIYMIRVDIYLDVKIKQALNVF
jgi:hypothetical protein